MWPLHWLGVVGFQLSVQCGDGFGAKPVHKWKWVFWWTYWIALSRGQQFKQVVRRVMLVLQDIVDFFPGNRRWKCHPGQVGVWLQSSEQWFSVHFRCGPIPQDAVWTLVIEQRLKDTSMFLRILKKQPLLCLLDQSICVSSPWDVHVQQSEILSAHSLLMQRSRW